MNFLHHQTLEIRGLRPQQNVTALIDTMRVFESRIARLRVESGLVEYRPRNLADMVFV